MKNLRILWNFMKGNRSVYLLSIIAIGLATFFAFIWPVILRITIDSVIGDKPLQVQGWLDPVFGNLLDLIGGKSALMKSLWLCSLMLLLVTIGRGLFLYFKGKWSAKASEAIVKNLREKLYDHLQKLPYNYHVKVKTGDLVQRCTSDVETIRRFLAMQFVEIGRALFMTAFAVSFMLPMHPGMTLVSLALMPFVFLFAFIFFLKIKSAFKNSDEAEGRLSTVLQENLTGVRVVRAFGRPAYEIAKFENKNRDFRDLTYKLIRLLAWYWAISDFVSLIQIGSVLIIGSYWAALGKITLGTLLAFNSYVAMLLWPIRQLGRILSDMGKTMVSVERVQKILDEEPEELGSCGDEQLKGEIEFQNVEFAYEPGKTVLKNISFKVKPGQTIAVFGPTGSGKTSLVHLLPRLYEQQKGKILLDGKDLREYDKAFLRRNIGIVLQEPFLFSKTIRENIALAKSNADEKDVYEVANIASVHNVINDFDQGYETAVGERGVTLSGGQKQRIAIARTLINETPILIFDDSLSAVDTETDVLIRAQLKKRQKQATTFIISHRLNSLAHADIILVLDEGQIVEMGNHTELMHRSGFYSHLWKLQNNPEISETQNTKKIS
jgi:ATP-binding cassette subfamily B protein